jgi:hypothetical protein
MNPQSATIRAAAITQALRQTAPEHLSPEAKYRFYERLGMLCGNAAATETELRIALLEAAEYDLNSDDFSTAT